MSDIQSELPIRSQLPGQVNYDDVIVKIGDGTNPTTQFLNIDSSGRIISKTNDGTGNPITSITNGAFQALSTTDQADGPVAPGTAAAYSMLAGGQFTSATGLSATPLTAGQQAALQVDSFGRLLTHSANFPATVDTNYGVVGANTIRTAAQIGNATGAADFNFGTVGAQTLRAAAQIGNATGAADFNFGAASAQTLRAAALIGNATGAADFNYGAVGAQTLRTAAELGNATGSIDYNYGAVSAQTIRTASQIGNATGAADFNNGATGAQTLRVAANLAVGGANVSGTNPVPVTITSTLVGTSVNNYNTAAAVAANATSNHTYTITAAKTFNGKKVWASASGALKIEVQVSPDGSTYSTLWVGFNSAADPNITIDLDELVFLESGTGSTVRVIRTNVDKKPMDVYSTISGTEV